MRRYDIIITNPKTGAVWTPTGFPANLLGGTSFTSSVNGQPFAGAWNIELDIFAGAFAAPFGDSRVQVWGVSLQDLYNATDLNYFNIEVRGGMAKGLPLATAQAANYGTIAKGTIFPAFGNWQGINQALTLILRAGTNSGNNLPQFGSNGHPANVSFNWKKGTTLAQAIQSFFSTTFNITPNVQISSNLVASEDWPFVYNNMAEFNSWLTQFTKQIIGAGTTYPGVQIAFDPKMNAINVFDGTAKPTTIKQLQFQDLIGQPTWLGIGVNFMTPLRSDLAIGSYIKMPAQSENIAIATQNAAIIAKNRSSFQGTYQVTQTRHVGNFREGSAEAWVTVVDAVNLTPVTGN